MRDVERQRETENDGVRDVERQRETENDGVRDVERQRETENDGVRDVEREQDREGGAKRVSLPCISPWPAEPQVCVCAESHFPPPSTSNSRIPRRHGRPTRSCWNASAKSA